MPRAKPPVFGWSGLNTKANSTGLPLLECVALQDMRVVGMDLVQRLGMVRVGQLSSILKSMDFDGTNEHALAVIDTRVWALGLQFTFEACVAADTLGDSEAVLTAGSTTPCFTLDLLSSKWRVRIVDSADATTTLTSTTNASTTGTDTIQVTRDGAALVLRLNGTSEDTDTMTATTSLKTPVGDLRVARSGGADYFDGDVDYVRLFSIVKTDHNDRLVRLPNPRARHVLMDMDFNETAGGMVQDRSRYENHLVTANSPTEGTSLCHTPAFVRALSMGQDENNKLQLFMAAGGQFFLADAG